MANDDGISEKKIIDFLKKNKNFFIKNSDLVKDLNFPLSDNSSDKVIDLEAYRYKKISQQNPPQGYHPFLILWNLMDWACSIIFSVIV